MRKLVCVALLLFGPAGCAITPPTPSTYGNFIQNAPASLDQTIAGDAVKQLLAVFPPASTRFDLQQVTSDAFGMSLVTALRAQGYALLEHAPPAVDRRAKPAQPVAAAAVAPRPSSLALQYVLDQDNESSLYRVTLLVGKQSLTRAYVAQDGTIRPASYWVRKE